MDEVDRTYLIGILNQYQVKLKNNKDVLDGDFILETASSYYHSKSS